MTTTTTREVLGVAVSCDILKGNTRAESQKEKKHVQVMMTYVMGHLKDLSGSSRRQAIGVCQYMLYGRANEVA